MNSLRALCACAPLLAASAAAGQGSTLAVVELGSPQELSGIAARLTSEIAAAAKGRYDVVEPREAAARLGPELLQKLRECKGNGACLSTYGAHLRTARAVVGSLERNDASYLVKLWLVDLESGAVVASVDRSVLIASRRLNADIAAAVPAFLQGKAEVQGKLAIQSNARGAAVVFDGEPVGTAPVTIEAKPGKHVLKVFADRYLPVERFVAVEAGRTEKMLVSLLLRPGALPPEKPGVAAGEMARASGGFGRADLRLDCGRGGDRRGGRRRLLRPLGEEARGPGWRILAVRHQPQGRAQRQARCEARQRLLHRGRRRRRCQRPPVLAGRRRLVRRAQRRHCPRRRRRGPRGGRSVLMSRAALCLCALAALAGAQGCAFRPDPEVGRFTCSSDGDCGDGYLCVAQRSAQDLGKSFCFKASEVTAEVCNGLDDDKDGVVDDDLTDLGSCDTGLKGVCALGQFACTQGVRSCVAPSPGVETCNGIDDDCDGVVDNLADGGSCP